MNFQELMDFITLEDGRLKQRYENYPDEEKRVLARMVKLSEETGELADAVLVFNAMQRQDKLVDTKDDNLSEEFADVIITALLLAYSMGVDIPEALKNKMNKINKRYSS